MSKNRITSEIDKKFVGKDSKGCYLLTYKYKNGFLQIHPIPKEGINKIILEFLKEQMKEIQSYDFSNEMKENWLILLGLLINQLEG